MGIKNSRDATNALDDDEKKAVGIADTLGGEQKTTVINESGLYTLIIKSRKLEAKAFKRQAAELRSLLRSLDGSPIKTFRHISQLSKQHNKCILNPRYGGNGMGTGIGISDSPHI